MVMWQIQALVRNKKLLGAALAVIFGIALLGSVFVRPSTATQPGVAVDPFVDDQAAAFEEPAIETQPPQTEAEPQSTPPAVDAIVYISGAVQHPDVYQVPAAARVKDVVLAAGGFTEDAAAEEINLADRIADAQHIHIRRQGEQASEPAPTADEAADDSNDGLVNLNTASAADLDALSGIGPSLAERIIEYRTTNGPFQSVEDLQKVKGIGPALFAKLLPLVTVGP
jgi:competence protein ComEA